MAMFLINKNKQNTARLNRKHLRDMSQIRPHSMRMKNQADSRPADFVQAVGGGAWGFVYRTLREDCVRGLVVPADQLLRFQDLLLEVFTEGLLCSTHTPRQHQLEQIPRFAVGLIFKAKARLKFKDKETRLLLCFLKCQRPRHSTSQNNQSQAIFRVFTYTTLHFSKIY